jgi:hypothetical protein
MTADDVLDAMRAETARVRDLAALGRALQADGIEYRQALELALDLRDARLRRDHVRVTIDDGTTVGWEAYECFEETRHSRALGRTPRCDGDDDFDGAVDRALYVDDLAVAAPLTRANIDMAA